MKTSDFEQIPQTRPNTTPREQEMSAFERALLTESPQDDGPGWISRNWDRLAFKNAKPGDSMAQSLWKEGSEAGSSFMAGLARGGYTYATAAKNSAEYIADKAGLQFDAKENFLAAAQNKFQNMQMEPTTEEWEDQLFYLLGQLAPDVATLVAGGGILGAGLSLGVRAVGFSKSAAGIATILGRITGDVAINTTQVLAHEAAQAELDGREAEYGRAGKDALVMAALMSTTGRAAKAFGLSRKSTAILTGTTLGGATSLYYEDDDPAKKDAVFANGVLGAMFGLAIPQTSRVGSADIQAWVKLRKQAANVPKTITEWTQAYVKEFAPKTHEKVFEHEPKREEKLYRGHWNDAEHMSPKDEFLLFLSQASKKNVFGYSDANIIQLIAETSTDHQLGAYKLVTDPSNPTAPGGGRQQPFEIRTGTDKAMQLKEAKVLMDAMNETDSVWRKDHPSYESRVGQPDTSKAGPQYQTRLNLKKTKEGSKQRKEGILATDADKKNQKLQAHELSWKEYSALEGDTPQTKELHKKAVIDAGNKYDPAERGKKKSWPNKGALIEHELWDDFSYIHSRPKGGFKNQGAAETGRALANRTKETMQSNAQEAHDAVRKVLAENQPGWIDTVYKWLVDPGGRILNTLEERGMVPVRNALQLQSLKKGKVEQKLRELDEGLDFWRMSSDEDNTIASYIFLNAEVDNVKRLGHDPAVARNIEQRPEVIGPALAALREDAARLPGGWEGMQKKITMVENVFADMFEIMADAGLVGKKTYEILKDYKYVPMKTITEAMKKYQKYILQVQKKNGKLDVVDNAIHDLAQDASLKGKHTNLESLMKEHISTVYSLVAKNELFSEMVKIDSDLWTQKKPGKRLGESEDPDVNYTEHTYMKDGEPTPIWIENKISSLLDAKADAGFDPKMKAVLRFISGVQPIQVTAVAVNPVFAVATHPLDLWSIAQHHQSLPSVPTIIKDMYIHNSVTGAVPMIQNFRHAFNRDDVYKKYLENDGVVSTIVSHINSDEMFKTSIDKIERGKASQKFKRTWNKSLGILGKFGHTMEIAMRMTETDMLVKTGKFTPKEAAHESLRRLNYNRKGQLMTIVDTFIPFANAQAQILASQFSEVKNRKAIKRTASTIAQLTAGLTITRIAIEENFPGYMKDIPWETRMRYWIIPTGAKEIDHKSKQTENTYFKIKKAYNPLFMIVNAGQEIALDLYYYGKDGLPPGDTFQLWYDALKVASPVELQNNIPPVIKMMLAWTANSDASGRDVYKGPTVQARDEINTELYGGKPTQGGAIALGNITGLSPAKLEQSYNSYVAQNPISWVVGSFIDTPQYASQSAMSEILKTPGLRTITGRTNKKWAEYEAGLIAQKVAGSSVYHSYHKKILPYLSRFYKRDIGRKEFANSIKGLIKDAKPADKIKMEAMMSREIKSHAFLDALLKKFPGDAGNEIVYDNIQNYAFWTELNKINDPEVRAEYYYDRMWEIDDPFWQKQFGKMAAVRGLFQDRFFAAAYRKLKRKGEQ